MTGIVVFASPDTLLDTIERVRIRLRLNSDTLIPHRLVGLWEQSVALATTQPLNVTIAYFVDLYLRFPPHLRKTADISKLSPNQACQLEAASADDSIMVALVLMETIGRMNGADIFKGDDRRTQFTCEILDDILVARDEVRREQRTQNLSRSMGPVQYAQSEPDALGATARDALAIFIGASQSTPAPVAETQMALDLFGEAPNPTVPDPSPSPSPRLVLQVMIGYPFNSAPDGDSDERAEFAKEQADLAKQIKDVAEHFGVEVYIPYLTTGDTQHDIWMRNLEAVARSDILFELSPLPSFGLGVMAAWAQGLSGGLVILGPNPSPLAYSPNAHQFTFKTTEHLRRAIRDAIVWLYPAMVDNARLRAELPNLVSPVVDTLVYAVSQMRGLPEDRRRWLKDILSTPDTASTLTLKQLIRICRDVGVPLHQLRFGDESPAAAAPAEVVSRVQSPAPSEMGSPASRRPVRWHGLTGREWAGFKMFCDVHKPSPMQSARLVERALDMKAKRLESSRAGADDFHFSLEHRDDWERIWVEEGGEEWR